ncbi:LRRC29.2 family protein [Megaselia abdita]
MENFVQNPSSFHLVVGNLCNFLTISEIKFLSVLTKEWKAVTDPIISKKCPLKIDKSNVGKFESFTRRYERFRVQEIPTSQVENLLAHLIKNQSDDLKNGRRKQYPKVLMFIKVVMTENTLKLLKDLEYIEELLIYSCNMDFSGELENIDLNMSLKKLVCTVKSYHESRVFHQLLNSNKLSLRNIKICIDYDIESNMCEDDGSLKTLDDIHFPNLEAVTVNYETLNFKRFFRNNSQLKSFTMHFTTVPKGVIEALQEYCPDLENLSVDGCETEAEDDVLNIYKVEKLSVLKLTGSLKVNFANLNFEKLETFANDNITPQILLSILPKMKNLKYLDLSCLQYYQHDCVLSSELLSAISVACPKLERLLLLRNPGINNNLDPSKFKPFAKLENYNFNMTDLKDELLFCLATPRLWKAQLHATCITDAGLSYLANNCPLLEKVYIGNCDSITDEGVSYLVENLVNLRYLCIQYCAQLTSSSFKTILAKKLLSANVSGMEIKDIEESHEYMENEGDKILIKNGYRCITIDFYKKYKVM